METRKRSTFCNCLSGFSFFYETRHEKVHPEDLHRTSLTEIGYLMIKKGENDRLRGSRGWKKDKRPRRDDISSRKSQ